MLQNHMIISLFVSSEVMHTYILLYKVFDLNFNNLCSVNYCTLIMLII